MNRLVLSARLEERGALRYTPAGLPALDLSLAHESDVSHEGQVRKVSMPVKSLVIGQLVDVLNRLPLGAQAVFAGFLAPARNGRGLLFHITELTQEAPASATEH
jgi:primosomal replication protein N